MLERTTAADGEVPARRLDPIRRWLKHRDKRSAPLTRRANAHTLARQHIRHEERAGRGFGDTVALGAERAYLDIDFSGHDKPPSGIPGCHRHLRSGSAQCR